MNEPDAHAYDEPRFEEWRGRITATDDEDTDPDVGRDDDAAAEETERT